MPKNRKKRTRKPRVRAAKPGDRNLFRKLWLEYLESSYNTGDSDILPNEKNLDKFSIIFDLYVTDELQGTVLFVGDYAVLMWGSPGAMPFETDTPNRAMGWGTYVKPEKQGMGISKILRKAGIEEMKKFGFQCIMGEVKRKGKDFEKRCKSAEAVGFNPHATGYIQYLNSDEIKEPEKEHVEGEEEIS